VNMFRTIESGAKAVYVKREHMLETATLHIFSQKINNILQEHVRVSSFSIRGYVRYDLQTTEWKLVFLSFLK